MPLSLGDTPFYSAQRANLNWCKEGRPNLGTPIQLRLYWAKNVLDIKQAQN